MKQDITAQIRFPFPLQGSSLEGHFHFASVNPKPTIDAGNSRYLLTDSLNAVLEIATFAELDFQNGKGPSTGEILLPSICRAPNNLNTQTMHVPDGKIRKGITARVP